MKRINSPSGIIKIEIAKVSDIAFFRNRIGVVTCNLIPGIAWIDLNCSGSTEINLEERPYTVKFGIPTPDNDNTRYLESFRGVDIICKITCLTAVYFVGSIRQGARISISNANNGEFGMFAGYMALVKGYDVGIDFTAKYKTYEKPSPVYRNLFKASKEYVIIQGVTYDSVEGVNLSGYPQGDYEYNASVIKTYNKGSSFFFETTGPIPYYSDETHFNVHPYVSYRFNCNINCTKVFIRYKLEVLDHFIDEIMYCWDADGNIVFGDPIRNGSYITLTFHVNGILTAYQLKFGSLLNPAKVEIIESYIE